MKIPFKKPKKQLPQSRDMPQKAVSYYAIQKKQLDTSPRKMKSKQMMSISKSDTAAPQRGRHEVLQSRRRKSIRLPGGLLTTICVLMVVTGVGYSLTLTSEPQIVFDETTAQFLTKEKKEYIAQAGALISEASIFNKTKLTFDAAKTTQALGDAFPEVAELTIEIPFVGRSPIVRLTLATPEIVGEYGAKKMIIGSNGVALAQVTDSYLVEKQLLSLPKITDEINSIAPSPGSQALRSSDVAYILTFVRQMSLQKTPIKSIVIPVSPRELKFTPAGQNYFIKVNTNEPAEEQAGAALATIAELKQQGIVPLQYIDVRAGEKVFYQ